MLTFADRPPHHLSFGQRRRVAVATVLAMEPEILVLDEPSSNLDPAARRELAEILRSLDVTLLMVTHDLPYALELCERSLILSDGVIAADGPTRELLAETDLLARHRLELPYGFAIPAARSVCGCTVAGQIEVQWLIEEGPMKLRLARHSLGDAVVVAVAGELDLFTAPVLRDEVRDAIKKDGARLVLDLQQLSFMDSSGLSVLIEAWRLATGEGGGVSLAAPQAPVARILRTTGLDRRIKVYADVDSAVGGFNPPRVELDSVGGLWSGYGPERSSSNHLRRRQRPRRGHRPRARPASAPPWSSPTSTRSGARTSPTSSAASSQDRRVRRGPGAGRRRRRRRHRQAAARGDEQRGHRLGRAHRQPGGRAAQPAPTAR